MRHVVTALTVVVAGLISLPAFAQPPEDGGERGDRPGREEMRERMLKEHDKDGDGKLSDEERQAAREQMRERMTKEFDKDGDGELSDEEREAMRESMRERFGREGREGRPGPREDDAGRKDGVASEVASGDRRGPEGGPGPDGPRPDGQARTASRTWRSRRPRRTDGWPAIAAAR